MNINIAIPSHGEIKTLEPTSLGKSVIKFSKLLTHLEVSRVIVSSVDHLYTNAKLSKRSDLKILYLFRPSDIFSNRSLVENATHIYLLLHAQDFLIYDLENELVPLLKNKIVFSFLPVYIGRMQEFGLDIKRVQHPVPDLPDSYNPMSTSKRLHNTNNPIITLWMSPSIRKNSLDGLLATLDACNERRSETITLNIISNLANSHIKDYIKTIIPLHNVIIEEFNTPNDHNLYSILCNSTAVILPSFDEGFNLPIYEAGRFGLDIICSDIPANRLAKGCLPSVKMVNMNNQLIVGNPSEEITQIIEMDKPIYSEMVSSIVESIDSWKSIKERMIILSKRNQAAIQIPKLSIDKISSDLKVSKRYTAGRAILETI